MLLTPTFSFPLPLSLAPRGWMLNVQRPVLRWSALSLFSGMMELEEKTILRGKRWKLGVEKDWSGVNWIELERKWNEMKRNEMFMFTFMFKRMIWFSIQNFKLSVFSFFIIAFFLFPAHFLWLLSNCHTFLTHFLRIQLAGFFPSHFVCEF